MSPSVTRRAVGGRAARREELRQRLLVAIEDLLDQGESFTELSVERLVSAAGASRSTFYVYFEDKGQLLRAWFEDIDAELNSAVLGWWALDGSSSREDLRAALSTIVLNYRPHARLMAALYDASVYDPGVRDLVEAMIAASTRGLSKHIRTGQADGFIDPALPRREVAAWLTWMAERGFHQLVGGATDEQVEKLIDGYTAIVWNTLYAPVR